VDDNLLNVSKLNGYMEGVISFNGNIREYSSNAFLLNVGSNIGNIQESIASHFSPFAKIKKFNFNEIKNDLTGLEKDIQNYLVVTPFGEESFPSEKKLIDWKKYISFRIMDIVDLIIGDYLKPVVYKVMVVFEESGTLSTFFCISFGEKTLVLQFLHNK